MRIFISYCRQDYYHAETIYNDLKKAGYEPWLDVMNIPISVDWESETNKSIQNSDLFVLIVSPWSINSSVVQKEYKLAAAKNKNILLVVIQNLENGQEIYLPSGLPWLDFRTKPSKEAKGIIDFISKSKKVNTCALPIQRSIFLINAPFAIHYVIWITILSSFAGVAVSIWMLFWLIPEVLINHSIFELGNFVSLLIVPFALWTYIYSMIICRRSYKRQSNKLTDWSSLVGIFLLLQGIEIWIMFYLLPIFQSGSELFNFDFFVLIKSVMPNFQNIWGDIPAKFSYLFIVSFIIQFFLYSMPFVTNNAIKRWLPSFSKDLPSRLEQKKENDTKKNQSMILPDHPKIIRIESSIYDEPYSERLKRNLEKENYQLDSTQNTYDKYDVVIAILSNYALENKNFRDLLSTYVERGIAVLPVLIETINKEKESEYEIAKINYIDARIDFDYADRKIVSILKGESDNVIARHPEQLQMIEKNYSTQNKPNSNFPIPIDMVKARQGPLYRPYFKMFLFPLLILFVQLGKFIPIIKGIDLVFLILIMIIGGFQRLVFEALFSRGISFKTYRLIDTIITSLWVVYLINFSIKFSDLSILFIGTLLIAIEVCLEVIEYTDFSKLKSKEWFIGGNKIFLSRTSKSGNLLAMVLVFGFSIIQILLSI